MLGPVMLCVWQGGASWWGRVWYSKAAQLMTAGKERYGEERGTDKDREGDRAREGNGKGLMSK